MPMTEVSFDSHGTACRGWFHEPEGEGPHPVVVLSHGYGFQHASHYWRSAEAFASLGIAVLDYDARNLGASDGQPRHLVHMGRQVEDLEAALRWVRQQPAVDPERVVVYGSSAGGGVAIEVAARDPRLAALLLVVPHVDGLTNLPGLPVPARMRLGALAVRDRWGRARGRAPLTLRIVGAPGEDGVLIDRDDAMVAIREEMEPGGEWVVPDESYRGDGTTFDNLCTAWEVLGFSTYRPGRLLTRVRAPILAVLASQDTLTPPGPQRRALARAGAAVVEVPGGHFAPFLASQQFEAAFAALADFLRERGLVTG